MPPRPCIEDLPQEVLIRIFCQLSVEDIVLHVRHVCKRWTGVVQDPQLWQHVRYKPVKGARKSKVVSILKRTPWLQSFRPAGADVPAEVLDAVTEYCRDIREMTVDMHSNNFHQAEKFVKKCRNIEHVNLLVRLGWPSGLEILSQCPNLRSLKVCGNEYCVTLYVLNPVLGGYPSLQHLDLGGLDVVHDHLLYLIERIKNQIWSLYTEHGAAVPVPFPQSCKKLETLYVNGSLCNILFDRRFPNLGSLLNLKSLALTNFKCSNLEYMIESFEEGAVRHLTKLDLSHCSGFQSPLASAIFRGCEQLRHLNLQFNNLTDQALDEIHLLHDLEFLNLNGNPEISDAGIRHLCNSRKLKYLNVLYCTKLTDEGMKVILNLEMLQSLVLVCSNVSVETLALIPDRLRQLRDITAVGSDLVGNQIHRLTERMPHLRTHFQNVNPQCHEIGYVA